MTGYSRLVKPWMSIMLTLAAHLSREAQSQLAWLQLLWAVGLMFSIAPLLPSNLPVVGPVMIRASATSHYLQRV